MTEVTQVWAWEDLLQQLGGLPSTHMRDMLASALAAVARQALQLAQSLATWLAGGMTPALQLTDTEVAFRLTSFARQVKEEVLLEQKHANEALELRPVCHCGPEEIMKISQGLIRSL